MKQNVLWKKSPPRNYEVADETESHLSQHMNEMSSSKSSNKQKPNDIKKLYQKQESLSQNLEKHKIQSAQQTNEILHRLDQFQNEIYQSLSRLSKKSQNVKNYQSNVSDTQQLEQSYFQYKQQPRLIQQQEIARFQQPKSELQIKQKQQFNTVTAATTTNTKPIFNKIPQVQTRPFDITDCYVNEKNQQIPSSHLQQMTHLITLQSPAQIPPPVQQQMPYPSQFQENHTYTFKETSQPQIFQHEIRNRESTHFQNNIQQYPQKTITNNKNSPSADTAPGSLYYSNQSPLQDTYLLQQEQLKQQELIFKQKQQELLEKQRLEQELFQRQQQEYMRQQQEKERQRQREIQQLILTKQAEIQQKEQEIEMRYQLNQQEMMQSREQQLQELKRQKMELEQYNSSIISMPVQIQSHQIPFVTTTYDTNQQYIKNIETRKEEFEIKQQIIPGSVKITTFVYDKTRIDKLKKLYYEEYRKAKGQFEENAKMRYEDLTGRAQFEVEDTYCKDCKKFFSVEEISVHNCKQRLQQQDENCFIRWYENGKKFIKDKMDEIFPTEKLRLMLKNCNEEIYEIIYGSLPKAIYLLKIETLNNNKLKNDFYLGHAIGQAILNCDKGIIKLKEHYRNLEFVIQSTEPMSGLNEHKVIFILHILFERSQYKVELLEKLEKK